MECFRRRQFRQRARAIFGDFDPGCGFASLIVGMGIAGAARALKFCEIQVNSQKSRPADSDQAA
jgi:hypothetical protein